MDPPLSSCSPSGLHQGQARALGVEGVGLDGELVGLRTQHELLPAADEDAHRAVARIHGAHCEVLGDVVDQFVAPVEQVVGRLAAAQGAADLVVDVGQLPGQVVHLLNLQTQLGVDAGLQVGKLLASAGVAGRHLLGAAQHHLARGRVGGAAGHVDHGVEELVGGVAQAVLTGREDQLQAQQVVAQRAVAPGLGTRAVGFGAQEAVVGAGDRVHVHALAQEATAGELRRCCGKHHLLARKAGRVRVGDVVAGDAHGSLVGQHGPGADAQ
jgi:hypothetical protein